MVSKFKERLRPLSVRISKKKICDVKLCAQLNDLFVGNYYFVPNVKVMSIAIESHVSKHSQKVKDQKKLKQRAERIREDLITKIL